MNIVRDISDIEQLNIEKAAVALGKFDGIHKGHRTILDKLVGEAARGLSSVVFTFDGNPGKNRTDVSKNNVEIQQDYRDKKIFTENEKLLYLEKIGIDFVIICPLKKEILGMSPEEFVREILVKKIHTKKIFCGENFRFGKDREGTPNLLKELGTTYDYGTEMEKLLTENGSVVSSTIIRQLIGEGKIEEANKLMGHPYTIIGKVVHGNELGRTLDTPTANIIPDNEKLLPPNGVCISRCLIDGRSYTGITNIGCKPTISEEKKIIGVETHLIGYDGNLYDRLLELEIYTHTRPEMKFDSLETLKERLERDKAEALEWEKKYYDKCMSSCMS